MSWSGAVLKVCMTSQPCFRAVSTTVRSMQKFSAPSSVRKHPETFCRTFVILKSRSASLFVNGTVRSSRKSKTAVFRTLNRNARLCPMRRFRRPRFFCFDRGARGGWFSWNVIAWSQQAPYRSSISLIASGSTASRTDFARSSLAAARRAEWSSCQTPTVLSQTQSAPPALARYANYTLHVQRLPMSSLRKSSHALPFPTSILEHHHVTLRAENGSGKWSTARESSAFFLQPLTLSRPDVSLRFVRPTNGLSPRRKKFPLPWPFWRSAWPALPLRYLCRKYPKSTAPGASRGCSAESANRRPEPQFHRHTEREMLRLRCGKAARVCASQ